MFKKSIDEITLSDIEDIVKAKIPESKTLDYKRELSFSGKGKEKKEKKFLEDIVAFANTLGGYIIYGIEESNGVPKKIVGFGVKDVDKNFRNIEDVLLKLESIIEDGIEPKIYGENPEERCKIKPIEIQDEKFVVIIKIPKSIYAPHRTIISKGGKFKKRGERKNIDMSYEELKTAFLKSGYLNSDRNLLKEFIETLPSTKGSIPFIKKHNMAGYPFKVSELKDLERFLEEWNNAEREFLDEDLEKLRKKLLTLVREYLAEIAGNTWPIPELPGYSAVPREWEIEQPKRFKDVVTKLHKLAGEIIETHQNLIRLGRKKLGI